MAGGIIEAAARTVAAAASRLSGVYLGRVLSNIDSQGLDRVLVHLLPGVDVWAHVAVPIAGQGYGAYLIPQPNDQVVVAFVYGDGLKPVVIGSVWSKAGAAPVSSPQDAVTKRVLRTPLGHELVFDDAAQSVTLTTSTKHKITLGPRGIELSTGDGQAKLTLEGGRITLEAAASVHLKAPVVSTEAKTLDLSATELAHLDGGKACVIEAEGVKIN